MNAMNFVLQAGTHNIGGEGSLASAGNSKGIATEPNPATDALVDDDIDDDEDEEITDPDAPPAKRTKKTKGRVKIKMEFIDNKLRRYTTFSKRKTGIMKKAYELSTLTGTQVMLLVASETGHVYTFATRKLQPMITSESGKALIQTCLNSPDPPAEHLNHHRNPTDQRMSATGFEETELTYAIGEEDGKMSMEGKPMFTVTNIPGAGADVTSGGTSSQTGLSIAGTGHTFPMTTYLPTTSASGNIGNKTSSANTNFTMTLPQGGFTTILPPGTPLPAGATTFPGLVQLQNGQLQALTQGQTPTTPTVYRLQQFPSHMPITTTSSSSSGQPPGSTMTVLSNVNNPAHNLMTSTASTVAQAAAAAGVGTPVMYQTPQGLVYAASPANIQGQPSVPQQLHHIAVPMLSKIATPPSSFSQASQSKDKEHNNNSDRLSSSGSKT